MEGQFEQVIREKLAAAVEMPPPALTRREATLPPIGGKALAVIGMRRAGKTSYLHQCRGDLLAAGRSPNRLIYFNFEDERLAGLSAPKLHIIPDTHLRMFPEPATEPITLFLDEIQLVDGWETFVRRLLDTPGYEIFLSGSSAKLLSREIASSMRGRAWEIIIHPFSFPEFLRHHGHDVPADPSLLSAKKTAALDHQFARYLEIGGFPEAQSLDGPHRRQLLQGYIDVLLLRDVIERHQVSNVTALRWLVRRLLSSPAGLFSVTKFAADLKSQGIPVSRDHLYEFLAHLEDAFLLQTIPVATDSEKRRQVNPRKVYPADPALIPVFDRSGKANTGHALESAVFTELQRRSAEITYVKTASGFEVDLLARYPTAPRNSSKSARPSTIRTPTPAKSALFRRPPRNTPAHVKRFSPSNRVCPSHPFRSRSMSCLHGDGCSMRPIDAENRTTISSATLTDSPSRHTPKRRQELAGRLYNFVFQQALAGVKFGGRTAA